MAGVLVFAVMFAAAAPSFAQAQMQTHAQAKKSKAASTKSNAVKPQAPHSEPAAAVASKKGADDDAHAAQNPLANVISIPFQNNTNFRAGPYGRTEDILLIEPVIPFKLNDDWNLITRTITPVVSLPRLSPNEGSEWGLGNLQPQFYFSPSHSGEITWGLGPQFWLPTATDKTLGVNKWGAGPAAAALTIQGPWVVGLLANNMWAGTSDEHVNRMTLNPFVDYNMPGGWYLASSPVITADWLSSSRNRWTVPVGGGVGRVFKVGDQSVNARVQLFNNVLKPAGTGVWTLQFQIQLMYPAS